MAPIETAITKRKVQKFLSASYIPIRNLRVFAANVLKIDGKQPIADVRHQIEKKVFGSKWSLQKLKNKLEKYRKIPSLVGSVDKRISKKLTQQAEKIKEQGAEIQILKTNLAKTLDDNQKMSKNQENQNIVLTSVVKKLDDTTERSKANSEAIKEQHRTLANHSESIKNLTIEMMNGSRKAEVLNQGCSDSLLVRCVGTLFQN